jgi:hypothetical protein
LGVLHVFDSHVLWNLISRVLWVWMVLATMFTRHESLSLFPLGLPQKSDVLHQPTHCSLLRRYKWKLKLLLKRLQMTCYMTQQTTLWFIHIESTRSKDSCWTCVQMKTTYTETFHESGLSFMYHMLLYHRKLQIYPTSKLLHVFLTTMYIANGISMWLAE